ncbi:MAG: AMP-binding protein [Bacteroides sp.]|nr:AMP-binding protein [Bacteroides sp.]
MTYKEFIEEWESESGFCAVTTSGSTGTPKSIRLPKALMRLSALRTISFFCLGPSTRLHSCISPDFIGGKMMAVRALICGAEFSWEEPSNHPLVPADASGRMPSLVSVVPSQMLAVVEGIESGRHPRWAEPRYLVGGAPLPTGLRRRISALGLEAWESYGMTETASHIAVRRIGVAEEGFRPLPGVKVGASESGCLVIDQGYRPEGPSGEEDNPLFSTPLSTNDIAELAPDGSFSILGRADNVIISGGKKIHPEMVEKRLSPYMEGREYMLTGVPDPKWGTRAELLVERLSPSDSPSPSALLDRLRSLPGGVIPRHELPKAIRVVDSLPRTPNGKLRRKG